MLFYHFFYYMPNRGYEYPRFWPPTLLYAGFCPPPGDAGGAVTISLGETVARSLKRRSIGSDETIAVSQYPNPPCITMSLPTANRYWSTASVPEAFHIHTLGLLAEACRTDSSLWHWSSRILMDYAMRWRVLPAWRFGDARTFLPAPF